MNLEGTIQERPLTSVLQMLGARNATGRLIVERGEGGHERLSVDFRNGLIVSTASKLRRPDLRIGELIRRGEYVGEDDINRAIARSETGGGQVGDILVAERKLDGVILGELLQLQMSEDLFDVVRWEAGRFRFESGATPGRPSPAPPITPRDFLSGCLKHLAQWSEIEAVIPDRAVAFKRRTEGPIADKDVVKHRLTAEDVRIYNLVHSTRSVSALLPLARVPTYQLYASLVTMARAELIEPSLEATFEEPPTPSPTNESAFTQVRVRTAGARTFREGLAFHAMTAVVGVALLALIVATYLQHRSDGATPGGEGVVVAAGGVDPARDALTAWQIERLRAAVEAWRVRRGELPTRLEVLAESGLLGADDLNRPGWERSYVLLIEGDSYLIIRPKK